MPGYSKVGGGQCAGGGQRIDHAAITPTTGCAFCPVCRRALKPRQFQTHIVMPYGAQKQVYVFRLPAHRDGKKR